MNIYIIIYFGLWFMGIGMSILRHNKPKEGCNNFYTDFISSLIALWILYMAGCFNHFIR